MSIFTVYYFSYIKLYQNTENKGLVKALTKPAFLVQGEKIRDIIKCDKLAT